METPRKTRSMTVLGKRTHRQESPQTLPKAQLQTPERTPTPKRARFSQTAPEGDQNKENVPPFSPASSSRGSSPSSAVGRSASRRRSSEASHLPPDTPSAAVAQLSLATPPVTPPGQLIPIHSRAKALLRTTSDSSTAPFAGRDDERAMIHDFVASFCTSTNADEDGNSSLYVSGSPGSGKTALVNAVLASVDFAASETRLISLNCMAFNNLESLWQRLSEDLDSKTSKSTRRSKKKRAQTSLQDTRSRCVLVLDEMDHIAGSAQSLTDLFSFVSIFPSQLRVIGIANTHTLTSFPSTFTSASRVQTLHFAPYTSAQLLQIVQSRLSDLSNEGPASAKDNFLKFLPLPTLTLLSKKVAALSGDVRFLFEVLRGAIEAAVSSTAVESPTKTKLFDSNPFIAPSPIVTPAHVLAALKAFAPSSKNSLSNRGNATSNETVSKVQSLGLQARLALLFVLLAASRVESGLPVSGATASLARSRPSSPMKRSVSPMKRSQSSSSVLRTTGAVDTGHLHAYYSSVLSNTESGLFSPVSRSEFGDLIGMLEGVGLVSFSSLGSSVSGSKTRRSFGRTVSFSGSCSSAGAAAGEVKLGAGVWRDEVLRGLGIQSSDKVDVTSTENHDIQTEEVSAVWRIEDKRIHREMKMMAREVSSGENLFMDAMED